jgi:hypothetical protein
MDTYQVKLTFTEQILGTVPKSKKILMDHIIGKALRAGVELTDDQIAEELQTVEEMEEKCWTGFHTVDDGPVLYDYVIKGFFKDACGMLRRASDTRSAKLQAHKKVIDGLVFAKPRQIPLRLNGGEMAILERPLRAQTAQGERVALARSDTCPAGTTLEFKLIVLGKVKEPLLREWLDYGQLRGLGQWRNAGYGAFEYELEKV